MAADLRLRFEALATRHDRAGFDCGEPSLDLYLKTQASQDVRRHVARVFVAVETGAATIAGYYTLGSMSIAVGELPEELRRKLPRYRDLPAALIGRLARDRRYAGRGLGSLLLADAVGRIVAIGTEMAVFAIVVDALDERARAFYEAHGFRPQASQADRLFLAFGTAKASLAAGRPGARVT